MKKQQVIRILSMLPLLTGLSIVSAGAQAKDDSYRVTVTNITRGVSITPLLVITHRKDVNIFELGKPASRELAMLAEGGAIAPLRDSLFAQGVAYDATTNGALLAPGESVTLNVKTSDDFDHISVAAMLIPTNDAFIAVSDVKVSKSDKVVELTSPAYDAGTEMNDELCVNIPGPTCQGTGFDEAPGEGFVHIHTGIHGVGDLKPAEYDWRNPVARIVIERQ